MTDNDDSDDLPDRNHGISSPNGHCKDPLAISPQNQLSSKDYITYDNTGLARCSKCKRSMPLRKDGIIRIHGPVRNRCKGSRRPPYQMITPQSEPNCLTNTRNNNSNVFGGASPPKVAKRIPRSCWDTASRKYAHVLNEITSLNALETWSRLLHFPRRCFQVPRRSGCRWNLSTLINKQIQEENDPPPPTSWENVMGKQQ